MNKQKSVVWPVLLISIGIIFLLSNLGVVSVNIWATLIKFWPVIFIIAGVDLLFFKKGNVGSYVAVIFVLFIIGAVTWASDTFDQRLVSSERISMEISHEINNVESANIEIEMSVGQLNIDSTEQSDVLVEGEISVGEEEDITDSLMIDGDVANYQLSSDGYDGINTFGFDNLNDFDVDMSWDLQITDSVPINLEVTSGVSESNLDLTNMLISSFSFEGGVGAANITLPEEGTFDTNIEIGVGAVKIYIPASLSVKIVSSVGIGDVSVRGDYLRDGDRQYYSSDFETDSGVTVYVDGGIGGVEIIQVP